MEKRMKNARRFLPACVLALGLTQGNALAQQQPDLLVSIPMTENNGADLFQRIITLMDNIRARQVQLRQQPLPDPFNGNYPRIEINQQSIGQAIPQNAETRRMLAAVNSILGINAGGTGVSATFTDLRYSLSNLRLQVDSLEPNRGNPILTGRIAGQGITFSLGKLRVAANIPVVGQEPLVLWAEINGLQVRTRGNAELPVGVRVQLDHSDPEKLKFQINEVNLNLLADALERAPLELQLDPNVPVSHSNVAVTIAGRRVTLNAEAVRAGVRTNQDAIQKAVREQIVGFLRRARQSDYESFTRALAQQGIPRDYWIKTPGQQRAGSPGSVDYKLGTPDLAFKLRYESVTGVNRERGSRPAVLTYDIRGGFCLENGQRNRAGAWENGRQSNFTWNQERTMMTGCVRPQPVSPSGITHAQYQESLRLMARRVAEDPSDRTATINVSHDYVNALLHTTIDAGLWDPGLQPNRLSFGDKKAFVRFDETVDPREFPDLDEEERRKAAVFYLDLVYSPGRSLSGTFQRIFVGRNSVRFPVKIYAHVNIVNRCLGGTPVPHLVIQAAGADCLDDGRCVIDEADARRNRHGLVSTVQRARFTNLIRSEIRTAVQGMIGREVFALPLREFPNVGVEDIELEVDGQGRALGTLVLGNRREFRCRAR